MEDFIYDGGVRIGYGRTSLALYLRTVKQWQTAIVS